MISKTDVLISKGTGTGKAAALVTGHLRQFGDNHHCVSRYRIPFHYGSGRGVNVSTQKLRCATCKNELDSETSRVFNGDWYHVDSCVETAIAKDAEGLERRGLHAGDVVYIPQGLREDGTLLLEAAVLVTFIKHHQGWWEAWMVHFMQDPVGELYSRITSPQFLIKRVDSDCDLVLP